MSNDFTTKQRGIAWNGIRLEVPAHWEAIVSGPKQLVFEDDFTPVFQIRWQHLGGLDPNKWNKTSDLCWQQLAVESHPSRLPVELTQLADNFTHVRYYQGSQPLATGGICYCKDSQTLVFFQLLNKKRLHWHETAKALCSLYSHGLNTSLWRIQDISLQLPSGHLLHNYSFKAGLTRISFTAGHCNLQFCKLSQAERRLAAQSLPQILQTLSGTTDLKIVTDSSNTVCSGQRTPSVVQQVLFRMRKDKPFIQAKIWKVAERDRLLISIASSTHPLLETDLSTYYENFKLV